MLLKLLSPIDTAEVLYSVSVSRQAVASVQNNLCTKLIKCIQYFFGEMGVKSKCACAKEAYFKYAPGHHRPPEP